MESPFVGRQGVVADVEQHRSISGAPVLIYGTAGVGKTRLARELLDRAVAGGDVAVWTVATSASASIPFAALAPLLPALDPTTDTSVTILQACLREVARRTESAPLTIAIDNAQLLDAASLTVVNALAGMPRVWLVLTVRTDDPVPDEIVALWKDAPALRIELEPLDRGSSDRLASEILGGDLDVDSASRLWRWSRGNPMWLHELLLEGRQQGTVTEVRGRWHLGEDTPVSGRLHELLSARLARLDDHQRRAALALTLVEPLDHATLAKLAGMDALADLERAGVVEVTASSRGHEVRFRQPLHGETLRLHAPHTDRVQLADALLDLMPEPVPTRGQRRLDGHDAVVRADLWRLAARPGGRQVFRTAARYALTTGAYRRAAEFAEVASERAAPDVDLDALLIHGEALTYLGDPIPAEDVLQQVTDTTGSDEQRAQAAALRFHNHLFNLGDPAGAERIAAAARAQVVAPHACDHLDAALSLAAMLQGNQHRALQAGLTVLNRPDPEATTLLSVLVVTSLARAMLGHVDGSLADIDRARPLIERCRDALPLAESQIAITEVLAGWHDARLGDAIALAIRHHDASLEGPTEGLGSWATAASIVLAEAGRIRQAEQLARQAVDLLADADPLGLFGTALAVHARCLVAGGDLEAARARLVELEPLIPRDVRTRTHADRAAVWLLAAEGETERAAALATERGRDAVERTLVMWGVMLLHDTVRFGDPRTASRELAALAEGRGAGLLHLCLRHARAIEERDPEALLSVGDAFAAGVMYLHAAEAAAQAAVLFNERGETAADRRASAIAADRFARTEALATPALLRTSNALTRRERQVALLARQGASSRHIAAQLSLSVRTVDNYLAAIYRKTGIDGRHQLQEVFTDDPPR